MNKTYALESRCSAFQNMKRYLMPGGRHQFTSSLKHAWKTSCFDEACYKAQKVGGMKVVEVSA
jgi:hypothetical protein